MPKVIGPAISYLLLSFDSDGTVIITIHPVLTGGSKRTAEFARKHQKPWLHLHGETPDAGGVV